MMMFDLIIIAQYTICKNATTFTQIFKYSTVQLITNPSYIFRNTIALKIKKKRRHILCMTQILSIACM